MVAAQQLIGLCQSRLWKARMCNAVPEPDDTEIRLEVDQSVETFLAAFGPQPGDHRREPTSRT
ncbi:TetR/AcrR family transcriptional regulator C-terminal domain-containing protein [Phenylobacterium sp.]|uniref:TetR/AcrR family transcriptional regulator C-terminal domain-containing protein n=1 Tax=Phenylobacterium sp. TaxID=1871053 RepID=UPI002733B190|nr:TetR/AcrR family transcriptional regulator C-terminal domain-containing protein [Phenylobacterium sp.]